MRAHGSALAPRRDKTCIFVHGKAHLLKPFLSPTPSIPLPPSRAPLPHSSNTPSFIQYSIQNSLINPILPRVSFIQGSFIHPILIHPIASARTSLGSHGHDSSAAAERRAPSGAARSTIAIPGLPSADWALSKGALRPAPRPLPHGSAPARVCHPRYPGPAMLAKGLAISFGLNNDPPCASAQSEKSGHEREVRLLHNLYDWAPI